MKKAKEWIKKWHTPLLPNNKKQNIKNMTQAQKEFHLLTGKEQDYVIRRLKK